MRQRTSISLLSAFLTTGCLIDHPTGFTTPEATVATFQTAFANDNEFAEYDCFARRIKAEQLTQQAWSLARARLFEPLGAFGRMALRRNDLADNVVARQATPPPSLLAGLPIAGGETVPGRRTDEGATALDYAIGGHGLRLRLLPETAVLLEDPDGGPLRRFTLDSRNGVVARTPIGQDGTLEVTLALPAALATRLAAEGTLRLELVRQWKLAEPELIEATGGEALAALPAPPLLRRELAANSLQPTLLKGAFGVTPARFELPLPAAANFAEFDVDALVWVVAARR